MIDSHCHPDDAAFDEDRSEMLGAAAAALEGLVAIGGLSFIRDHRLPPGMRVWATEGIHPHEAAAMSAESFDALENAARDERVIGIGEIGLDYHYDHSPRERQQEVFALQLALAAELRLPVVIHCREAWDDCLAAIEQQANPACGVFHCFHGGQREAERALELGWYLSFSGMLTFPKLEGLRKIAAWAPTERVLVETDAPFLAPVPRRGRRNEPAWVWETARQLAICRGQTVEEIEALTRANFFRLFPRAASAPARNAG